MTEIVKKKFEILNYTISDEFTIDGLADKLNELTNLQVLGDKNKEESDFTCMSCGQSLPNERYVHTIILKGFWSDKQ